MSWDFDYSSISAITSLLQDCGLSMTKKFGQNFLISQSALDKIVSLAGIEEGTVVWEVGPGFGALTSVMLKKGAKVTAFEIDHGFCRVLKEKAFADEKNFNLIEGDALKTWLPYFKEHGTPDIICANLPYNVGSLLIASFIENRCLPSKMVYTLQAEVVSRICAGRGDDDYGGFSILTSLDYENKEALRLKAGCFFPAPNVDSSVVVMTRKQNSYVSSERAVDFLGFVRAAFAQRRKTLSNNLRAAGFCSQDIQNAIAVCLLQPGVRAEELDGPVLWKLFSVLTDTDADNHSKK